MPEAERLARENEEPRRQIAILLLDARPGGGTAVPPADATPESLPAISGEELDGTFDPALYGMPTDWILAG
jgi:hypothetical protein